MFSATSKSCLVVLPLLLLPLLLQRCLGSVQYLSNLGLQTWAHADIFNFSDSEIDPTTVVSPTQIHQEYLRLRPPAKTQDGIALALYIPHADRILIPHFDRTLLTHELAHYFTFHYLSAPRTTWEEIANRVVDQERSIR